MVRFTPTPLQKATAVNPHTNIYWCGGKSAWMNAQNSLAKRETGKATPVKVWGFTFVGIFTLFVLLSWACGQQIETKGPIALSNREREDINQPEDRQTIDIDYLIALRTANLFLIACVHRDAEVSFNLLSERLKSLIPEEDLRMALSGVSNPHHHAFEIFNGRSVRHDIYEFQIYFYSHYTDQQVEFNKGDSESLRVIKDRDGKWFVDTLPEAVSSLLEN